MKILLLAILLFLHGDFLIGQSSTPLKLGQIDSLVDLSMRPFQVPGLSLVIVKDGQTLYQKGYSVRSIAAKEKVDENTLFGIASNSKAFTAAAIGILVQQKKLSWDAK